METETVTFSQLGHISILCYLKKLTSKEEYTLINYVGAELFCDLTKSQASHLIDILRNRFLPDILYPGQNPDDPDKQLASYPGRGQHAAVFTEQTHESLAANWSLVFDYFVQIGKLSAYPDGVNNFSDVVENINDPAVYQWCIDNPANHLAWLLRNRWEF